MKKYIFSMLVAMATICLVSCSKLKSNMDDQNGIGLSNSNIKESNSSPNVPECPPGYHWSWDSGKCVADDCPTGYHWDNLKSACVVNTIYVIANPQNPDDSIGSRHNQALSSIMPEVSSTTTDSEVVQLTINYLVPYGYDTTEIWMEYDISDSLGLFGYSAIDSLAYKMYANGEISSTAESYMLDLSSLLNNVIGNNDPIDSIYDVFANEAIYYENEINSDNSLSSDEKEMLLSGYAIARYSAAFWGNYLNNNSGGISSPQFQLSFFGKFWKKIIGADGAGSVVGGGNAAAHRQHVGHWGLIGGIIGSAAEAIKDLLQSI